VKQTSIFRKVSLDRLSSPEQLDQLLQVTDTRGWIALAALGAVLAMALVWGFVGRIPENVTGTGMLIKSGGIFEVVPAAGGRVADVAVSVGDVVTEGQVVARVEQPDLAERVQQARIALVNLRQQHRHIIEFGSKDVALQTAFLTQQRATVEQSIASHLKVLDWLKEKVASQERLVEDGLLTRNTLLSTRQQYDGTKEKLGDARSQLTQIAARRLELENRQSAEARSSLIRVEEQEREVVELERELKAKTAVVAPYTGRILEIMTERGNVVAMGEPILSLDLSGRTVKELEAVIYVPSVQGKQIRPGMAIQIAPSTVKQEEFGRMLGRVTYVSDFPATGKGMRRVLKNDRLVATLSGQDAPYEVHADLEVDPATVSRYKWSSSKGPPLRIQSGTLAVAYIAVKEQRPVELVVPLLRKYTGI